ncbi:CAP domain-containing protein [Streptomyces asoensis]|uniref:CAP domain-containing protein n=1 Tax=Streptomyces asoensis TaxID=249586 RepID=A0A6M4WUU6_9ACTN|nr:CAP domain-containing protein [Streptomyces asoensis]QJT04304.1 CAP domain-containing protein [Streptomyces asoensis]
MGRHRRSAAGSAATSRATGVTQTHGSHADSHTPQDPYADERPTMGIAPYLNPEAYADSVARSREYLYATGDEYAHADTAVFAMDGFRPDDGDLRPGSNRATAGRRRKRKVATPVKTGLLGVSAAVAIGTVAVATGVVPGLDNYQLGGGSGSGDKVQAADSPTNSASEQGGTSGSADTERGGTSTSRDAGRSTSPSASPTPSPSTSTASASPTETATKKPQATPSKEPKTTPSKSKTATKAPEKSESPVTVSAEAQAAAEVLKLVNEERAKVGCSAVSANSALSKLAEKFSDDMAARGFFDHTDPDGATPWDRAAKAGIADLGGENIARGQADAAAVMEAWMNSPGHKANILNCDFKTLGVGVHLGSGGPWWTQDFGY